MLNAFATTAPVIDSTMLETAPVLLGPAHGIVRIDLATRADSSPHCYVVLHASDVVTLPVAGDWYCQMSTVGYREQSQPLRLHALVSMPTHSLNTATRAKPRAALLGLKDAFAG
jgi:hypothetical protein